MHISLSGRGAITYEEFEAIAEEAYDAQQEVEEHQRAWVSSPDKKSHWVKMQVLQWKGSRSAAALEWAKKLPPYIPNADGIGGGPS